MNLLFHVLFVVIFTLIIANFGIHKIEEGHVGVYYRVNNCNFFTC